MATFQEIEKKRSFESLLRRMPARLKPDEVAKVLGFAEHDIRVLVRHKLLKPLGDPSEKSTKYFAAVEILELAKDLKWLSKATKVVSENWKR